jgi:hypothetical protein
VAVEVDDEAVDYLLAAPVGACEATGAQMLPQDAFGISGGGTEHFG